MADGRSKYVESPPSGELTGLVDAFWRRREPGQASGSGHRVLPDGCVDILIDLVRARAWVVGAMTRALVVSARDPGEWLAVRFRPGGAAAVFGGAVASITDERVDLGDLRIDAAQLVERVVTSPDAARLSTFGAWVSGARRAPRVEPLVARATERLLGRDAPTVDVLAAELGVTRQHLTRTLRAHVGIGAKQIARVGRLKRVLATIDRGDLSGWAAAAVDSGYYDQSHLIAETRALAGLTPGQLATERRGSISPIAPPRRVA